MAETRLLVPLDGSALAERAIRYILPLAALGAMQVRLLGVVNDYDERGRRSEEELDSQRRLLRAYLTDRQGQLLAEGVQADHAITSGTPAAQILTDAANWQATLIALTTHGRSGLERWRIGSVADKVIRSAVCDTLVIGPHLPRAGTQAAIESILVPLDGSELAEGALITGKLITEASAAQLHILRSVPFPVPPGIGYGLDYSNYPELMNELVEGAKHYLAAVKSRIGADEAVITIGDPATGILDYAQRRGVDLIVMTSHGRSGVLRSALGSVADRMIGGATPVLIVRPPLNKALKG